MDNYWGNSFLFSTQKNTKLIQKIDKEAGWTGLEKSLLLVKIQ